MKKTINSYHACFYSFLFFNFTFSLCSSTWKKPTMKKALNVQKNQIWIINLQVGVLNLIFTIMIFYLILYTCAFLNLFIQLIITISDRIKTSNNENNKLIFLSFNLLPSIVCVFLGLNHISRHKLEWFKRSSNKSWLFVNKKRAIINQTH